jgi:hypothetical protein
MKCGVHFRLALAAFESNNQEEHSVGAYGPERIAQVVRAAMNARAFASVALPMNARVASRSSIIRKS